MPPPPERRLIRHRTENELIHFSLITLLLLVARAARSLHRRHARFIMLPPI